MRFGDRLAVCILVSASLAEMGCPSLGAKRDIRSEVDAQTQYEASIRDAAVVSPDKVLPLANLPRTETIRVARWVSDNRRGPVWPMAVDGPLLNAAPGSVSVLRRAAQIIARLGHLDEAIELYRRALAQDPLSTIAYGNLATVLDRRGRLIEAEAGYRKALELSPHAMMIHSNLALNLLAQGRGGEALAQVQQEPEEWAGLYTGAIVHHAAGRLAESEAALQELIAKHQGAANYQVAHVYAQRGEADLAFAWLERAYATRDPGSLTRKLISWPTASRTIRAGECSCARWGLRTGDGSGD